MAGESLVPESPEARGQHDRKDLEAINANARELNEEAEDVLGYQVDFGTKRALRRKEAGAAVLLGKRRPRREVHGCGLGDTTSVAPITLDNVLPVIPFGQ